MSLQRKNTALAFTLVELLVVIVVVAVLAALIFPALGSMRKRSLDAGCVSNLRQIGVAMGLWAGEYGAYPPPQADVNGDGSPDGTREWCYASTGDTQGRPSLFRKLYSAETIPFLYGRNPAGSTMYHLKDTVFVCPSAARGNGVDPSAKSNSYTVRSYGMNSVAAGGGSIAGWRISINPLQLAAPSKTFLLIDSAGVCTDMYYVQQPASVTNSFLYVGARHEGHLNVLYCDLHVGSVKPEEISKSKTDPFWGYQAP